MTLLPLDSGRRLEPVLDVPLAAVDHRCVLPVGAQGLRRPSGLATGLILTILGTIIWLVIPAKPESKWKTLGPFGRARRSASRLAVQRTACGAGFAPQAVSMSKRGPRG